MRRRQRSTEIYTNAIYNIDKLERAEFRLMAPLEGLLPSDVLDWLIPSAPLRQLRAALPYANVYAGVNSVTFRVPSVDMDMTKVDMRLSYAAIGCVPAKDSLIAIQPEAAKHEQLLALVETLVDITRQYDKLRDIVKYFNSKFVTPGAARYYFPTMASLLPTDHPFHKVGGERFKAVAFPMDITDYLREAPEIIAKGTLCDPAKNGRMPSTSHMVMQVNGEGQYFAISPETK